MKEPDFKSIGKKIRERRKFIGVTQEYIANHLDVNPSHISNIECGRANPSLAALIAIANLLQCSVDYFISSEYTYQTAEKNLDDQILEQLNHCNEITKRKLIKIIEIL